MRNENFIKVRLIAYENDITLKHIPVVLFIIILRSTIHYRVKHLFFYNNFVNFNKVK